MQTLKMKFKYEDDETRIYAFDCEDSLAAAAKPKILSINQSLDAGTDDGLSAFFVSDYGESLVQISGATLESETSTPISIAPNS